MRRPNQVQVSNTDIRIDGKRHLGTVVGTPEIKDTNINNLVVEWTDMLNKLIQFNLPNHSLRQPTLILLTVSATYFMRTLDISSYVGPLDKIITHELIPTVFGCPVSFIHRELMSLPLKKGGMGMPQLDYLAKRERCIAFGNPGTGKISCYTLHGINR